MSANAFSRLFRSSESGISRSNNNRQNFGEWFQLEDAPTSWDAASPTVGHASDQQRGEGDILDRD